MSDETKAPARDVVEVIKIMRPVFEWATRDAIKCAQLRDGLAVATDGRVLVRVELPGFRPTPEVAAGCVAGVLDFVPEEGRVVAGREWIERELAPHVEADWTEVRATADRKRADEWTRANTRARRCPCCGAELVADADGDVWTLDEWIRMEAGPSERDAVACVEISTNVGAGICVFLRDLARALDAARKLGGADALRIGRGQLRLDGAGFTVVVCRVLPDARAFRRFLIERGAEVDGAANTPPNSTKQLAGGVEK